jgi:hypothetical protein
MVIYMGWRANKRPSGEWHCTELMITSAERQDQTGEQHDDPSLL